MFLLIRSGVKYLSFHLRFLLWGEIAACVFYISWFHFYSHYYFHYVCFLPYKKPLFDFCQALKKNQVNTQHQQQWTAFWICVSSFNQNRRRILTRKSWDILLLKLRYWFFLGFLTELIWHTLKRKNQACSENIIKNLFLNILVVMARKNLIFFCFCLKMSGYFLFGVSDVCCFCFLTYFCSGSFF